MRYLGLFKPVGDKKMEGCGFITPDNKKSGCEINKYTYTSLWGHT
jgi:hypothetical protein